MTQIPTVQIPRHHFEVSEHTSASKRSSIPKRLVELVSEVPDGHGYSSIFNRIEGNEFTPPEGELRRWIDKGIRKQIL